MNRLARLGAYWQAVTRSARRPRQIVICGCSRGGTTLLYNMLRSSLKEAVCPPQEQTALKYAFDLSPMIVTKRPLDVLEAKRINRRLSRYKHVSFLVVVRDPRSLVSSLHTSAPDQYFQGFDYQMMIGKRSKGYVKPGLLAIFDAIDEIVTSPEMSYAVVRYEDLVSQPDEVQQRLSSQLDLTMDAKFSDFHTSDIPAALRRALNGVRPVDPGNADKWKTPSRAARVFRQFRLEPRLFDVLERWGYEKDRRWFDALQTEYSATNDERGTIVTFCPRGQNQVCPRGQNKVCPRGQNIVPRMAQATERLGLASHLEAVGGLSDRANALLRLRRTMSGPLLYVDPGAVIHDNPWPYLADVEADVAAYIDSYGVLHDETLFFRDTQGARRFLERWTGALAKRTRQADVAAAVIRECEAGKTGDFTFHRLPVNMCWNAGRRPPYIYGSPIIEHAPAGLDRKVGDVITRLRQREAARLRQVRP